MEFTQKLVIDETRVLQALGFGAAPPDAGTMARLADASQRVETAASARWVYTQYALAGTQVGDTGVVLPGEDIRRHLDGCDACILLAVTLGGGVETKLRAAQQTDMALAVMMDVCASVLVEQYTAAAQDILYAKAEAEGRYLTGRYSPGYGDFPLGMQPALLRLTNAQRAIGLTATEDCLLLPRKSVTAVLGVAGHPVSGRMAGCDACAIREKCDLRKEGKTCG